LVGFYPPQKFTLDDFRKLLDQAINPAAPSHWMTMLPGVMDEAAREELGRVRGIIDSMTPEERRDPVNLIQESRSRRIAAGAGVEPGDVEQLVRQFEGMADIMDRMDRMARRDPPWGAGL
jgi:signal recognition particle subunit SRP54